VSSARSGVLALECDCGNLSFLVKFSGDDLNHELLREREAARIMVSLLHHTIAFVTRCAGVVNSGSFRFSGVVAVSESLICCREV